MNVIRDNIPNRYFFLYDKSRNYWCPDANLNDCGRILKIFFKTYIYNRVLGYQDIEKIEITSQDRYASAENPTYTHQNGRAIDFFIYPINLNPSFWCIIHKYLSLNCYLSLYKKHIHLDMNFNYHQNKKYIEMNYNNSIQLYEPSVSMVDDLSNDAKSQGNKSIKTLYELTPASAISIFWSGDTPYTFVKRYITEQIPENQKLRLFNENEKLSIIQILSSAGMTSRTIEQIQQNISESGDNIFSLMKNVLYFTVGLSIISFLKDFKK